MTTRSAPGAEHSSDDRRRAVMLAGLVGVLAIPYLVRGPGWFVDDWETLRNGHFEGWLGAAGSDQWGARPGAGVSYAIVFGLIADPVVVYGILVLLNMAVVVVGYRLLRRFVERSLATLVCVVWVLMPNHTSTSYWASAVNISVALLLALLACDRLARAPSAATPTTPWMAAVLAMTSVLFYEVTAVLLGAAAIVAPLITGRRPALREILAVWGGIGLAGLWMVVNWHPHKPVSGTQDISQVIGANFGLGVLPPVLVPAGVLVLGYLAFAAGTALAPSLRRLGTAHERVALAGLGLIVVGVAPFVRYVYAPLGLGDRANVVSALGAAMVWGVAAHRLVLRWRPAAIGVCAVVAFGMLWVSFDRAATYARAAEDGEVLLDVLAERYPEPGTTVLVGPQMLSCDNVVSFLHSPNLRAAFQLRMGDRDRPVGLAVDEERWRSADVEERVDQAALRPASAECR